VTEKDKTISQRMARYEQRNADRGIVKVGVRVPEHRRGDIVEIARKMRDEEEARGEQESEG
jgi:hypothetical protein